MENASLGPMTGTPGFTPVRDPKAVEFVQHLTLDTQLDAMLGNPAHFANDADVNGGIVNVRGAARTSADKLKGITGDLTVTEPVRHEYASKVANGLIATAEATQAILASRAKDYVAAAEDIFGNRFKPDPTREGFYLRGLDWIREQAKNQNGGYANIREAVTDEPDFAVCMYNYSWRLMGLPEKDAFMFKERIVEKFAPDALAHIETSHKLDQLAKRYPGFIAKVHSSFYSPLELAKIRTRFTL